LPTDRLRYAFRVNTLTSRQRAVLAVICDTFQPPTGASGDGTGQQLLERVVSLIDSLPNPDDRSRLRLLLGVMDSALVNLLLAGKPKPFTAMDLEDRIAVLRGWGESAIQLRRAGFQALKRLVNVAYYVWPTDGGSHPAWRAVGYPGPLPPPPGAATASKLPTLDVTADTILDCDVVVVGSGAGGGVAACALAEAGRSVIVLERGPNLGPRDFTQVEGDMLQAAYLDGGLVMTQSGSLPILAGSCLGGGTVVNWTTSFALREPTRAEWDRLSGLSLFSGPRFAESLARVMQRTDVNTENSVPGVRDQILERGLKACGWHVDVIPRNATACVHGLECGYCGYGCRHGAKNSTAKTYLASAVAHGARIVVRCDVQRVVREGGRAVGVEGLVRTADARSVRLTVRAKAVVAAAGALHTPALLARSGLASPRIGRGLRLHPVSAVAGFFAERVEPWSGNLQTRHSDQFANQDQWYGAKFETGPVHWALPGSAFGWEGPAQHRSVIGRLGNISVCGILLRDRDAGRVVTGRDGRPRVHYELSTYDARHLRAAMLAAAQVLAAAGAKEIFTLQQPSLQMAPGGPGWLDRFAAGVDERGLDRCRMALISFHQMASCAMGAGPDRGVVGETGESFETPGLYVADGSAFVTSSGVNPMITIMAIADHIGRGIAERW
jgi:choline dehydrogenase-like flavoprotein